ncbi:MAG: alpha/beta hydrolase [Patescibacteria group bacterium]
MPKKETQIFYIHGGMTFKNKRDYLHFLKNRDVTIEKKMKWSDAYLEKKLGRNFQIIRPRMPLQDNAKYYDWATHFERYIPKLKNNIILIGESLGGIFLAKYLSENTFPKKIRATYLICPPFDNSLPGEDLVGGFTLKKDISKIEKNSKKLYLLFSKNDPVVPPSQAKKYAAKLKNANIIIYDHIAGHFQISEFPEIIKIIKADVRK